MALVINSSSYVSEIIRGGILAVDKGQTEAARSLGMTSKNCMMKIVLPQAIKSIIPSLGNEYIMMIKETSLASTLAYNELMFVKTILSNKFLIWQPLFIISGIYLMVTLVLTYGVSLLEKRLSVSD
jgi:ABC-type amino acid transport system permease subunit